jgi:hypothetical protein
MVVIFFMADTKLTLQIKVKFDDERAKVIAMASRRSS